MASFMTKAKQRVLLNLDKIGTASTVSTFQKTGKLTPDEFIKAGDFLVENFPSWKWGSGDPSKTRPHLPADKQFLQTQNVPCFVRGKDATIDEMQVETDEDGGWVQTSVADDDAVGDLGSEVQAMALDTKEDEDDDDDIADVPTLDENFDYAAMEETDTAAAPPPAPEEVGVMPTRTYDITITYDVHYSTPRVWLFGYDQQHNALKGAEWREDFSKDHVDKTVTHEQHPHFAYSCPSIHPCKHAEAMTRMIEMVVGATGSSLDVKYYIVIFLKFIQSIIPNIEYDYTGDFTIREAGGAESM